MSEALRITAVNAAYDATVLDCDALLARYDTLTEWCDALVDAGARVHVVQRFPRTARRSRGAAEFTFVADGRAPTPSPWARLPRVVAAVAATRPHLVHVNGLGFPSMVHAVRAAVGLRVAVIVQDHAGVPVPSGPGLLGSWRRARWTRGLASADAIVFSAERQAAPWRTAGIIGNQQVLALLERSTLVRPTPRVVARLRTGLAGQPQVLWVGRLVPSKDPLTVLAAFERVAGRYRDARLAMVFQNGTLADDVGRAVHGSPVLRRAVTLVGRVSHDAIADWYGAADVFVSGSHAEGSGYALIEAMACGLIPVVTAIPSFVAIAGPCGIFFAPGDVAACADALARACEGDLTGARAEVSERFSRQLSWPVIAERTLAAYRALVAGQIRQDRG